MTGAAARVSAEAAVPAPSAEDIVVDAVLEESPVSVSIVAASAETITDAVVVVDEESAAVEEETVDEVAIAARFLARADADAMAAKASAASASIEKESTAVSTSEEKAVATQPTRAAARAEVTLTSKRLDDLSEAGRETADLLTADRLLDPHRVAKPEPEGAWSHFLYTVSGRRINIGDGKRARERKALTARIAAPLVGGARFVPVLSRKGGVGKTTITALLGMALADARDDRVIAVDANPDRGTLADRVVRPHHSKSVRDLVRIHDEVKGYHDISAIVARDATRLDVLASDADPRIAEAFSDDDYRDVAGVAAHYYSLVLTDTGTGIVHSVMAATLDLADQIVIVSGLSVDEARLASETLTWLETNGYAEQARDAIVVLNQSTPGAPLVRLDELESHFATRAKRVVRMPYDTQIAGGGAIVFANLQPETRAAARELAALLVEGLRGQVS
ncbi:AAA family ATPase [Microbacterium sp. SSW1-49]|uniref:AAA family ATPase n=2 Tax=Microbacterium croceum TaxID=2851645 RepID=A0ABT0FGK9_9MICO|nr:AAA family ATPase [Microbacterium croceum]